MTGFLDLPGEIRNRIYSHVFPKQQILLRYPSLKKPFKISPGRTNEELNRHCSPLYATSPPGAGHLQQELVFSAQVLRVCHKVHDEALPLLYTSVALHFESMKAINCFLSVASVQGIEQITKLAITQPGYGEPRLTNDTTWKTKHDQRWVSTCKRIAKEMTGVQHLRLCLQICDWPCQLNLSAAWAKPLFFLKGKDGLDRVDIYLHSSNFPEQRLEAAARMVERAMMSAQGRAQRQLEKSLEEIARLEEEQYAQQNPRALRDTTNTTRDARCDDEIKQPKARKVLTIKMDEEQERLPRKKTCKTKN